MTGGGLGLPLPTTLHTALPTTVLLLSPCSKILATHPTASWAPPAPCQASSLEEPPQLTPSPYALSYTATVQYTIENDTARSTTAAVDVATDVAGTGAGEATAPVSGAPGAVEATAPVSGAWDEAPAPAPSSSLAPAPAPAPAQAQAPASAPAPAPAPAAQAPAPNPGGEVPTQAYASNGYDSGAYASVDPEWTSPADPGYGTELTWEHQNAEEQEWGETEGAWTSGVDGESGQVYW